MTPPEASVPPREDAPHRIQLFVSHSHEDARLAALLVEFICSSTGLSAKNVRCTSLDGSGLPGGAYTSTQLQREVATADAFIALLSPASVASHYVSFELGARWGTQKHLLPILSHHSPKTVLSGSPLADLNMLHCGSRSHIEQAAKEVGRALGVVLPAALDQQLITRLVEYPNHEPLKTLSICEAWRVLPYLPIHIAQRKGFFATEGLSVKITQGGGDYAAWKQLVDGKAQLGIGDPIEMLKHSVDGDPTTKGKLVSSLLSRAALWGVTRKSMRPITRAENLRKKTIACFRSPSTSHSLVQHLAREAKGGVAESVRIIEIAPQSESIYLDDPGIDFVLTTEPAATLAERDKAHRVFSGPQFFDDFLITGMYSTETIIEQDRKSIQGAVNALDRSLQFISDNPLEAMQIAVSEFNEIDRSVIQFATLRLIVERTFAESAIVSVKAWSKCLQVHLGDKAGNYPFDQWIDNSFAQQALHARSLR